MSAIDVTQIIMPIIATIVSLIGALVSSYYRLREQKKNENKTRRKIDGLSNFLKEARSEIDALEKEVKTKSQRLQELDEHSRQLDSLISLKEQQVEGITKELNSLLRRNTRSNRIWTIIIGAFWFIFGLILRGVLGF